MENPRIMDETLMMPEKVVHPTATCDNTVEEIRNLLEMLDLKTEILYRECRFDQRKVLHIRTIGAILSAMTVLVNRQCLVSGTSCNLDIFTDAQGFTYQTVRACDLDRISEK